MVIKLGLECTTSYVLHKEYLYPEEKVNVR